MKFELKEAISILEKTPHILTIMLSDLPDPWISNNEGEDTWSPFDIMGHLIHGEKTDWIPRAQIILQQGENNSFKPFDRFAQFKITHGKSISTLLDEFSSLRKKNIAILNSWRIDDQVLNLKGTHPELGKTSLRELLSTWVVHDLGHIHQICRVMAQNYKEEVGPWINYLGVLNPYAK